MQPASLMYAVLVLFLMCGLTGRCLTVNRSHAIRVSVCFQASLKQKAVDAAAASRAASECVPASARPSFDGQASVDSVGVSSVPASQPQSRTLSVAAVRMLKSSSAAPSPSTSGVVSAPSRVVNAPRCCKRLGSSVNSRL